MAAWSNPGGQSTAGTADMALNPYATPGLAPAAPLGMGASASALSAGAPAQPRNDVKAALAGAVAAQIESASGKHGGDFVHKEVTFRTLIPADSTACTVNAKMDAAALREHFAGGHRGIAPDGSMVERRVNPNVATVAHATLDVKNDAPYGIVVTLSNIGNPAHACHFEEGAAVPGSMYVAPYGTTSKTLVDNPFAADTKVYMGKIWSRADMDAHTMTRGGVLSVAASHPLWDVLNAEQGPTNPAIAEICKSVFAQRAKDPANQGAGHWHSDIITPDVYAQYCKEIERSSLLAASKSTDLSKLQLSYTRADGLAFSDALPDVALARPGTLELENLHDTHRNLSAPVVAKLSVNYLAPAEALA